MSRRSRDARPLCHTAVVNPKDRAGLLLLSLFLICGGAVWGVVWYRSRPMTLADLYKRLPARDAIVVYADFSAIKQADLLPILDHSTIVADKEYLDFEARTQFNYTRDLNTFLIAFSPRGKYILATGNFELKMLRQYAQSVGGECMTARCEVQGSTADRRISFAPLQRNVLAMAVTPQPDGVRAMLGTGATPMPEVPNAPVWLRIPGSALRADNDLPAGTKMFAHTLERAESMTLWLMKDGDRLGAHLEVVCSNGADAASIATDLNNATSLLRQAIEREHHEPNPADLSGVLTSGSFRADNAKVQGYWPIERSFIANMVSGTVQ